MGTLIYTTDDTAAQILTKELCGKGVKIRMFTTDHEEACVALSVDLDEAPADYVAHLRGVYDLAPDDKRAFPAVIVKGSGFKGRGVRAVDTKIMDETMGAYFSGGANAQLLGLLSPLLDVPAAGYAAEWRARAALGQAGSH